MMNFVRQVWIVMLPVLAVACVTLEEKKITKDQKPNITEHTTASQLVEYAVNYGGDTLKLVKQMVKRRNFEKEVEKQLTFLLTDSSVQLKSFRLLNAMNLYQSSEPSNAAYVFDKLVRSSNQLARQLSWDLAAFLPSTEMAKHVEQQLSIAIMDNELQELFCPGMAEAIANNKLKESYTILRQGLFETNHVSFAKSMAQLAPARASFDFMSYLSRATLEELRQLTVTSVDPISCVEMLKHLVNYPVAMSHPRFENLFFYSVSRNEVLATMARKVLEKYMAQDSKHLAFKMSLTPVWVQIAFVEASKRTLTPVENIFLKDMRKVIVHRDVLDEISNVIR